MPTLGGVTYTEPGRGSPIVYNQGQFTATRTFLIPYTAANIINFTKELVGYSTDVGGEVVHKDPEQHPIFEQLYVIGWRLIGVGTVDETENVTDYTTAEIEVTYGQLPYGQMTREDEEDKLYQTTQLNFAAEFVTMQEYTYEWASGPSLGDEIPQQFGILLGTIEIHITRHSVPTPDLGNIYASLGYVNGTEMSILGTAFAAEHVLFASASARQVSTILLGSQPWEIDLLFIARTESCVSMYT